MLLLVACAGNPPAWWNPSGRYGQTQTKEQTASAAKQTPGRRVPIVKEEKIDPLPDSSYEEEVLPPIPEDEDTPAVDPVAEPALDGAALPAPSVLE